MRPHKVVSWIRRKLGGVVFVVRQHCDGTLGNAMPCILCSKALQPYDIVLHCTRDNDAWFHGSVSSAPEAKFTSAQARYFNKV